MVDLASKAELSTNSNACPRWWNVKINTKIKDFSESYETLEKTILSVDNIKIKKILLFKKLITYVHLLHQQIFYKKVKLNFLKPVQEN